MTTNDIQILVLASKTHTHYMLHKTLDSILTYSSQDHRNPPYYRSLSMKIWPAHTSNMNPCKSSSNV